MSSTDTIKIEMHYGNNIEITFYTRNPEGYLVDENGDFITDENGNYINVL